MTAPAPAVLLKAFDDHAHAEALARHGRLRFSTLRYYRTAADPARRDGCEGKAHNGHGEDRGGVDEDRCFICSFTAPDAGHADEVPDKFGDHVVRIHDPARLLREVAAALARDPAFAPQTPALHHGYVRYDLDDAPPPRSAAEARRRAWLHKGSGHRDEAEFRLMFEAPRTPPRAPHHYLQLGNASDYVELIVKPAS